MTQDEFNERILKVVEGMQTEIESTAHALKMLTEAVYMLRNTIREK